MRTVWRHRWLLWAMVQRDLRSRYAGSVLGTGWSLLQPLVMLGIYAVLFQAIFRVRLGDVMASDTPFVVYVALALWPWLMFQEGLTRGLSAVVQQGAIVKKVAFPVQLVVYSSVLSSFAVHVAGYALVLGVLVLWGVNFQAVGLWAMGLALVWLWVLACGLAMGLAALQVFVRDTEQVIGQLLTVLFYATPILYPMALVPDWLQQFMLVNPLVHVLEPARALALGHPLTIDSWGWSLLAVFALAFGVWSAGHAVFRRLSPFFEDAL